MEIHVLTSRNNIASPQFASVFSLEDILVETCGAKLISPSPRRITKLIDDSDLSTSIKRFSKRNLNKLIGQYRPIQYVPTSSVDNTQVLFINALNPAMLSDIACISEWRKRFDIVIAFVQDAWLLDGYPRLTSQIDHLLVPVSDLVEVLSKELGTTVSFWPHGADVLGCGSRCVNRSVDVMTYGRVPSEYHLRLFELFNDSRGDRFYYRQILENTQHYPRQAYDRKRFDYQHRKLLGKVLANSKITLAFDFTYTVKQSTELKNSHNHPSYRYQKPALTTRWFEGLAAGCAIVGKRPRIPETNELIGWKDATIEVPDDIDSGIALIMNLLKDNERLNEIHLRNYKEMLRRHDQRWRIKSVLERLSLPIPITLQTQLEQIEQAYACCSG